MHLPSPHWLSHTAAIVESARSPLLLPKNWASQQLTLCVLGTQSSYWAVQTHDFGLGLPSAGLTGSSPAVPHPSTSFFSVNHMAAASRRPVRHFPFHLVTAPRDRSYYLQFHRKQNQNLIKVTCLNCTAEEPKTGVQVLLGMF